MNVEARLKELIGDAAGRLHTARSRNDQVATDFRLWVRDEIDSLDARLEAFQRALVAKAAAHAATVMPGFTHLQTAQPMTFGHHLLAYVEMAARDRARFASARGRVNENRRWGRRRLAGTSFPIDREQTARELGFCGCDAQFARRRFGARLCARVLECVRDHVHASVAAGGRDRAVELAAVPFIRLSDAFSTGSSIMPQKRNPDAAELVRAKCARVTGDLGDAARRDEGVAARLCEGHAGGQRGGVRRGRFGRRCRLPR